MAQQRRCFVFLLALLAGGCTAPRGPRVVTDPDPSVKIPAFEVATSEKDKHAIPQMVADLDSDDAAVRFYAIEGLQRITGQTFGYAYYEDEDHRKPAVDQWKKWLAGQGGK